jgi:hypothetical protein
MSKTSRFPFRITLLVWLVLITTAWNVVRLATAWSWRNNLATYSPHPGVFYIAITGLIWALAGLLVLWSFWRGIRWTRPLFLITAGAYCAWVWADRLIAQNHLQANWPFDLLITAVLLGFTAYVVLDKRNEIYFRKE